MEVNGVECNHLRGSEEGVKVNLLHGAGHAIGARGGTHKPPVPRQGIVDALTGTNRASLVKVLVLRITGLQNKADVLRIYLLHSKGISSHQESQNSTTWN